jgi:hypothetical protein
MIRSELKYLIEAKIGNLKCRVFDGKTGPFPMVRVFHEVRPVATVGFRVEPYPEPTREFGPVANTRKGGGRGRGYLKRPTNVLLMSAVAFEVKFIIRDGQNVLRYSS